MQNYDLNIEAQKIEKRIEELNEKKKTSEMSMSEMMELQRLGNELTQMSELTNQIMQMFHSAYMSFIRNVGKSQ